MRQGCCWPKAAGRCTCSTAPRPSAGRCTCWTTPSHQLVRHLPDAAHQPSLCPTLECERKANLTLLPYAELTGLSGEPGAFTAAVHHKPRYVDPVKCNGLRRVRPGVP